MKNLFILFIVLLFSCKITKDVYLYDVKCKIVKMDMMPNYALKTYVNNATCGHVFFQNMQDTTRFFELSTCYDKSIDMKWFSSHKVSDVVYVDHIKKKRFFKYT